MLDVHAPHGPAHGWREFVTHIAAIAVGLLLALALEKTAEFVHDRHKLTQSRRELAAEVTENLDRWQRNQAEVDRVRKNLATNLEIIQALRTHAAVKGQFDYGVTFHATLDGSWQAARQNGSLDLMPNDELITHAWFHQLLGYVMDAMHGLEPTMKIAGAIAASALPERISAHDLDELASKTMEAQGRLENFEMFLEFEKIGLNRLQGPQTGNGRS